MRLDETQQVIAKQLEEISKLFIPGMKLTFVARYPGQSETEMVITDDDIDEVTETLRRSKMREFRQ